MSGEQDTLSWHNGPFTDEKGDSSARRWAVATAELNAQSDEAGGLSASWMWTLADLSILLLTFFVLVFASTVPDEQSWRALVNGLSARYEIPLARNEPIPPSSSLIEPVSREPGDDLRYVRGLLRVAQQQEPALRGIDLQETEAGIWISVPAGFSRNPSSDGAQALVRILDRLPNQIMVEAHLPFEGVRGNGGLQAWESGLVSSEEWASFLQKAGYDARISRRVRIMYGQEVPSHGTATAPAAPTIGFLLLPEAKG